VNQITENILSLTTDISVLFTIFIKYINTKNHFFSNLFNNSIIPKMYILFQNNMIKAILSIFLILSPFFALPQEMGKPFITNYRATTYGAHVQNWTAIQDGRGVMYFGNSDGILQFDGVNWELIALPSRDIVRSMAIDSKGKVFIGGSSEIGYLYQSSELATKYVSIKNQVSENERDFLDVWETFSINDEIFFRTSHYIFRYSNNVFTSWKSEQKLGPSFIVNTTLFVPVIGKGLYHIVDNQFIPAPKGDFFSNNPILVASSISNEAAIVGTTKSGFVFYKPFSKTDSEVISIFKSDAVNFYLKYSSFCKISYLNDRYFLSTPGDGCIVIGTNGDILQQIDQTKGLLTNRLHSHYFDRQNNLWFPNNNGISKVDVASPITSWDVRDGLDGTVESIFRFNGKLFIGTHQGMYFIDKNLVKKVEGLNTTCWTFFELIDNGSISKTRLLVGASDGIYEMVGLKLVPIIKTQTYVYELYRSKFYPNRIFACMTDGVRVYRFVNGKLELEGKIENLVDNVRSIYEESKNTIWLGTFRNGAVKLKLQNSPLTPEVKYYKTEQGLGSNKNVLLFPYNGKFLFGCENGLYLYNDSTDRMEPISSFGSQFCSGERDVFNFIPTEQGRVWISGLNNKRSEIGYLTEGNGGKFDWFAKPFKQIPEMMVLAFFVESDGTAWIGGSEGLFKYKPTTSNLADNNFFVSIRNVKLMNDSVLYNGIGLSDSNCQNTQSSKFSKPRISYKYNSISFSFAAQSFINEQDNFYTFILEGNDMKWSPWQKQTSKEYTNLREGDYTFRVKAKNIFEVDSNEVSYCFTISPPWYRTYVAYLSYLLFLSVFIFTIVLVNTKRLKAKNAKLEELVAERTSELSEVNTQLEEQQAELEIRQEEIIAQAHLLEEKNKDLEKLSLVARETDNAVIIMDSDTNFEWVNEGFIRMYNTDLKSIMREIGSSLLQASQNIDINLVVNECKNQRKTVTYQTCYKMLSGESKWIQTSLTPIVSPLGEVTKLIAIESDITKLKLAELEIHKHRDELVALNNTKDKFFNIIAHDLRNPFNNMMGLSELLIEKIVEDDKVKSLSFAKVLFKTSNIAYELLENLLTWSRSQSGAIEFNPEYVDLKKVLDYNVLLLESPAQVKGVQLRSVLKESLIALADKNMVLTIIRNLVTNAIKFSREGDSVELNAIATDKVITVSVRDTGVGMSNEVTQKLFRVDMYVKTEGTANEPGTGLGLILCKEFVEKNSGKIWVESTVGEGSCFFFTLKKGIDQNS
jgi:signal transduction histidine kinase/ligand-binding sensor domain-containing protein